jgi:hypothetical protein
MPVPKEIDVFISYSNRLLYLLPLLLINTSKFYILSYTSLAILSIAYGHVLGVIWLQTGNGFVIGFIDHTDTHRLVFLVYYSLY